MSTYVAIKSACGRVTTSIDIFDLDLNPHGVVCCGECETLIQSREAWDDFDDADYMEMYWGMDDND